MLAKYAICHCACVFCHTICNFCLYTADLTTTEHLGSLTNINTMYGISYERTLPHVVASVVDFQMSNATHESPVHSCACSNSGDVPVPSKIEILSECDAGVEILK